MKSIDIILLIPLLFGAYLGYKKGLLLEIVSLLSFFVALIGAIKLLDLGIEVLDPYLPDWEQAIPIISFILLFVAILIVVNMIGKIAKKILDMTLLGGLDNFAGSIIGLLKWAFGISVLLWAAETVDVGLDQHQTEGSHIYPIVASVAPFTIDLVADYIPFIKDFFESMKEQIIS